MSIFRPTYIDKKSGETKIQAIWWYEFVFAGKRIRESAKTTRKTIAKEAEKQTRLRLEQAYAGVLVDSPNTRIQSVKDLLAAYQKGYAMGKRPKSILVVKNRSSHLNRLLGSLLLPTLNRERLVEYVETRTAEGAGGRTINIELGILSRAIGRTWRDLWPKLSKLEENNDVGRALEHEEEKLILDAAAASRSPLIYSFLQVLLWTGLRSDEARTLRWSQVDFKVGEVRVGASKTEAGAKRVIPMTSTLRAILEQHYAWYVAKLGAVSAEWYVFPSSNRIGPVDATRPVTSLKRAWEGVRKKSGVSCRLHDLRHTFCTKLAEASVPESVMLDMMGHVSPAMLRRYSHIRSQARHSAMATVEANAISDRLPKESPKVESDGAPKAAVTH